MTGVTITFAESALVDLEAIQQWYTDEGVPQTGRRVVAELMGHIAHLGDHPDMGRIVPEFSQRFLRELIHPPYRIVYRREPDRVRIVRVWRSERLLKLPE